MLIGYGIVTKEQYRSLSEQLSHFGCHKIFIDIISPANHSRLALDEALSYLKPNHILVISQLDHLGKSPETVLKNLDILLKKKANLQIIESSLLFSFNKSSEISFIKLLIDYQKQHIKSQNKARKNTLKSQGKKPGRKPLSKQTKQIVYDLLSSGNHRAEDICNMANISQRSFYKIKKEFNLATSNHW